MFEQSLWLPPVSQTTTLSGNPLPLMPSKVLKAAYRYAPVLDFDLTPSEKNTQQVKNEDANGVKIEIIRPLGIGYGNATQIVLARVLEGREEIKGKKVVLRFFDPLYVTPEWLAPILIAGTVIVTFQIYTNNIERPESSSSTSSASSSDSYSAMAASHTTPVEPESSSGTSAGASTSVRYDEFPRSLDSKIYSTNKPSEYEDEDKIKKVCYLMPISDDSGNR
jgi:hypothetical protein